MVKVPISFKNKILLFHQDSETKRILLAVIIGIFAKLFSILVSLISLGALWLMPKQKTINMVEESANTFLVSGGHYIWNYSGQQILKILLIAPIAENIKIPIIFWVFSRFTQKLFLPLISLTVLSFFLHGGGIYGIGGSVGFFIIGIYYFYVKKHSSIWQAYYYSVIAHFTANFLTLIISTF